MYAPERRWCPGDNNVGSPSPLWQEQEKKKLGLGKQEQGKNKYTLFLPCSYIQRRVVYKYTTLRCLQICLWHLPKSKNKHWKPLAKRHPSTDRRSRWCRREEAVPCAGTLRAVPARGSAVQATATPPGGPPRRRRHLALHTRTPVPVDSMTRPRESGRAKRCIAEIDIRARARSGTSGALQPPTGCLAFQRDPAAFGRPLNASRPL